jgi:hypothetical protein
MKSNLPTTNSPGELAVQASAQAAQFAKLGGERFIRLKGKTASLDGFPITMPFEAIVLDAVHEYAWYRDPYNPDTIAIPACFALGEDPDDLVPHESSTDMQGGPTRGAKAKNPNCAVCWANAFASAATGRGKACRNMIRVALQTPDLLYAEPPMVRVSPMGLRGFGKFVKQVTQLMRLPTWAVYAQIDFEEKADYPLLRFSVLREENGEPRLVEQAKRGALRQMAAQARPRLLAPYDFGTSTPQLTQAPARKRLS